MKISILGSRGIPNNYGGFEQCAENLARQFVQKGHKVIVYNNKDSNYLKSEWKGVNIQHIYSNESLFKNFNVFITDFLSLFHAVRNDNDIILALGSAPNPLFYHLKYLTKAKIITNIAGLEWKRSKWNNLAKFIIKFSVRRAIKMSDGIIADNLEIQRYIKYIYNVSSEFIAYGTKQFSNPDQNYLKKYSLKKYNYYMCVARSQPDNNVEMILKGLLLSKANNPIIVVGNYDNSFGRYLKNKYKLNRHIIFTGGIYNYEILSTLRWFSKLYFHGHSCGGTNPALLDAMASNALIVAHDNPFNKSVLANNGRYFKDHIELANLINTNIEEKRNYYCNNNQKKIRKNYLWDKIANEYLNLFKESL